MQQAKSAKCSSEPLAVLSESKVISQVLKWFLDATHPKKLLCGAWVQSAVCYLCLLGQIFGTFYRRDHPLHCQEGSQVGCVGGDDDEREEPPHATNDAARQRPARGEVGDRETKCNYTETCGADQPAWISQSCLCLTASSSVFSCTSNATVSAL